MRTRFSQALRLSSEDYGRLLDWKGIVQILLWPLAGLLCIAALWGITQDKINQEKENAWQSVFRQTSAAASSYATQLNQTIQQIDQMVLNVKYDWEEPAIHVDLEKKQRWGLFPNNTSVFVTAVDARGHMVTSTLVTGTHPDFSTTEFFQQQKNGCCPGLLISKPETAKRLGRTVIRFSRRLNKADGSFDGVAFASVEASYLSSFQDEGLSKTDFISLRMTNGPLLATRLGGNSHEFRIYYRQDPIFPTSAGVALEPAEKFRDGKARIVAWRKLQGYPLVALAALSEHEALASYRDLAQSHRQAARIGTLLLALLAIGGMFFSAHIAWRRQREEDVRETYRLATDAADEGFAMIRPIYGKENAAVDFLIEDCNERGAALIGKQRQDLIGAHVSQLLPTEYRDEVFLLCQRTLEHGFSESEVRVPAYSPLQATWIYRRMIRSSSGLALTVRDISEAKQHEKALSNLANSDALTKLPNRRWLTTFLPTAIKHAGHGAQRLAVLFIDLDNFKNINDTMGHEAGDELLQQAAHRLKDAVRASDHVVRLGGDEFTVILEHVNAEDDVAHIAQTIVSALKAPFTLAAGTGNQVNASIGISMYPQDGTDAETLLKHADIAMYAAKAAGKGRYHFYQSHLSDALLVRMSKERALRQAIDNDEFIVHYQPRVGVTSGRLSSMEALVRWEHPERGTVFPTEFIDLAEDLGLVVPLGELVINKVCAQLAQWRSQGLDLVPVSINVSPQQLKHGHVSTVIASGIAQYGLDASLIEVEITETAVIDNSQTVSRELAELRRIGITLMIDDFGTGHSSLAQLHKIDVDVLKVDQEFTRALCEGAEGYTVFRAIVSMAAALDMCVVAEGVETPEQLHALRALSCDEIQGHFISKAIAASEISRIMRQPRSLLPLPHEPMQGVGGA